MVGWQLRKSNQAFSTGESVPFGFDNQVPISSRRKPLSLNVAGTPGRDPGRHSRERRVQANRRRTPWQPKIRPLAHLR
jgi:hypothetical protein